MAIERAASWAFFAGVKKLNIFSNIGSVINIHSESVATFQSKGTAAWVIDKLIKYEMGSANEGLWRFKKLLSRFKLSLAFEFFNLVMICRTLKTVISSNLRLEVSSLQYC